MSRPLNIPDRATLNRIIREEASAHGVEISDITGTSSHRRAYEARAAAVCRVIAVTGCSRRGLAKVWGMTREAANNCARSDRPASPYDANTCGRLHWAHGSIRAEAIILGDDPQALADIAAWRGLRSSTGSSL